MWVALLVFVVRLAAIMAGSWLGCQFGGVKAETQRRCFWMSMVTQVGGGVRGVWREEGGGGGEREGGLKGGRERTRGGGAEE